MKVKVSLGERGKVFWAFTALYAVCMAGVFWGTWGLDRAPVEPDNAVVYPVDDLARWFARLAAGGDFVPSDLMRVFGGMYVWQELQYALAGYLAALGVAFYLRGRGASPLAAYGGGAAFGLSGYCFTLFSAGHLGWFVWLMYGPFAFGLTDRCVRKGAWRNWALLGAVLAWAGARQPDLWLLFTALTFAYGMWCLCRDGRAGLAARRWGRLFAGVALCAAAALAVGAPQFRRAVVHDLAGRERQIAETSGKTGADAPSREDRWRFCTNWSLPPEDILEFVVPDVRGGSNDPRVSPHNPYKGRLGQCVTVPPGASGARHPVTGRPLKPGDEVWIPYRQHTLYFGVITVLLALVGVFLKPAATGAADAGRAAALRRDVPFWVGAGGVALLCAMGCFTPFYRLVFALPFGDALRAPVKFVHLVELSAAVMAGYGLEALRRRFGGAAWAVPALAVLAAANVVDLARVDARYLAVQDLTFAKAPNDAAADAVRLGGGRAYVALAPQNGGSALRDSLYAHGLDTDDSPANARFLVMPLQAVDAATAARVKRGELAAEGRYTVSTKGGVRRADAAGRGASLALLRVASVPPPPPPAKPRAADAALTILSLLATAGVAVGAIVSRRTSRNVVKSHMA